MADALVVVADAAPPLRTHLTRVLREESPIGVWHQPHLRCSTVLAGAA